MTLNNSLDAFDPRDNSKWYKTVGLYNAGPSMNAANPGNEPIS
jgi:hypothetical protein